MKTRTKYSPQMLFIFLLAAMLAACGHQTKFVAPEIEPPPDLIPAYVPEGFKLDSGFQLDYEELDKLDGARALAVDDDRPFCVARIFLDLLLSLKSPAGNNILGLHYQDGDKLLLITESYFPGGTLNLWRTSYEAVRSYDSNCEGDSDRDCDCDCCCHGVDLVIGPRLEGFEVQEVRTIAGTPTLIFVGKHDPISPPDYAESVAETLRHHYYYLFPNMAHGVMRSDRCVLRIRMDFHDDPSHELESSCKRDLPVISFP